MKWSNAICSGAEWIVRKRLPAGTDMPYSGLLPAGFSAEHLGPNDYYYWDYFWRVAGLRAAADWFLRTGFMGGLDNQLFQYAMGRSLSLKLRKPLKITLSKILLA